MILALFFLALTTTSLICTIAIYAKEKGKLSGLIDEIIIDDVIDL